jgi:hypothetical protein
MPEALWRTLDGDESERILGRAKVGDLMWNVKVVLEIVTQIMDLMVVCLECEKHVERMSAFTYNHERRS